jgi:hypothetical protein
VVEPSHELIIKDPRMMLLMMKMLVASSLLGMSRDVAGIRYGIHLGAGIGYLLPRFIIAYLLNLSVKLQGQTVIASLRNGLIIKLISYWRKRQA